MQPPVLSEKIKLSQPYLAFIDKARANTHYLYYTCSNSLFQLGGVKRMKKFSLIAVLTFCLAFALSSYAKEPDYVQTTKCYKQCNVKERNHCRAKCGGQSGKNYKCLRACDNASYKCLAKAKCPVVREK